MKIVRQPSSLRIVTAPVIEAKRSAGEIVADARAEAEALREAARREADAIRESARNEGMRAAQEEAVTMVAKAKLEADRSIALERQEIVALATEIVRAVLGREALGGESVLRDEAHRAITRVRRARRLVLKLHPDDVSIAERSARSWLPAGMESVSLAFEPDPRIERGFLVVESDIGRVDARLDRQLEAITRALETGR